jgi:LasA protease
LKLLTASAKKTKSTVSPRKVITGWASGLIAISIIASLSACTSDYVSVEEAGILVDPTPVVTEAIPTVVATLPQEVPTYIPPTATPVPPTATATIPVGVGSGDAIYEPTIEIPDDQGQPEAIQPTEQPTIAIMAANANSNVPPTLYYTQAGDTLDGLAARFHVNKDQIQSANPVTESGFLDPNLLMMIPKGTDATSANLKLIPDSEVVFSPSGLDFDTKTFVADAGGYLSTYKEYLNASGWLTGAGVIERIATENSINPRLLLSILEYRSHWVYGRPGSEMERDYPMGKVDTTKKGLYQQLAWAVSQINVGYYGWREGITTDITFTDGSKVKGAPELNAGTFALQFLFAQLYDRTSWEAAMYTEAGYAALHNKMFGNAFLRAMAVEPLFPATLQQPSFILPFEPGIQWSFTGGPHAAWGNESARAALDFAPDHYNGGCAKSNDWVVAMASGVVARTGEGVVVLDLDGDGVEQTGWDILYMHIATDGKVKVGDFVEQGQHIGHPSCEGGVSTGTHTHIARKFNGEWILAGGPLPFDMDGWTVHAAAQSYKGTLSNGLKTINACACGTLETVISRPEVDVIQDAGAPETAIPTPTAEAIVPQPTAVGP